MRKFSYLALLPFANAIPHVAYSTSSNYDYVIIGGGTSGLVVANRLSELKDLNVLVIEAGGSVYNNPNVTDTNAYGQAFDTDIDWAYETIEQKWAGETKQIVRAGKALGGTSTINGMVYSRAQKSQIDAWEKAGNNGWNWDTLLPYFKKGEGFQVPTNFSWFEGTGITYNPAYHGYSGPLKVGWSSSQMKNGLAQTLNTTFKSFTPSIQYNQDLNGGQMVGYSLYPKTIDSNLNIREDAARAYYYPFQTRSNLHVWLNTTANKITWRKGTEATADGVEVTLSNGTVITVKASREVILAAGALKSPLLLELSGIGNPE